MYSKRNFLIGYIVVLGVLAGVKRGLTPTPSPIGRGVISEAQAAVSHPSLEGTGVEAVSPPSRGGARGEAVHPIRGVHDYDKCFPDVQDVQLRAAKRWGVRSVRDREDAERRKKDLVCVDASPYYQVDRLSHSIPYLVPRAAALLHDIGRAYMDSLDAKGVPMHRLLVTSVLRSEHDVSRLRRRNGNATENSCHLYGTTFDISYNRYITVQPPEGPQRRATRNDSLKYILCEVLRDKRREGRCYIKYEHKQGCFHMTVR